MIIQNLITLEIHYLGNRTRIIFHASLTRNFSTSCWSLNANIRIHHQEDDKHLCHLDVVMAIAAGTFYPLK